MIIKLKEISIRDLTNGYEDNEEEGVIGYNGKLDIRPKYQREFVYNDKQRDEVIKTIFKDFPLNVMYWVKKDGTTNEYEVLDGQQRTISICQYVDGDFSLKDIDGNAKAFYNLTDTEKEQILNYKLMVYFCEGADKEKLDWFKTINIAGEKLTDQELRNAIYTGIWLSDSKRHFSKTNCAAYNVGSNYVKGSPIKQEILEKVLKWISNGKIEDYMSKHQKDKDCSELWQYFKQVIGWVEMLFPMYREDMKGIEWGDLYNKYKNETFNNQRLEEKYTELLNDEELGDKNTKGIYLYLITGLEKHLNLRSFSDKQKRIAFENQKGICVKCNEKYTIDTMEGDHIIPWSKGGKTDQDNCQMLCKKCNGQKSNF